MLKPFHPLEYSLTQFILTIHDAAAGQVFAFCKDKGLACADTLLAFDTHTAGTAITCIITIRTLVQLTDISSTIDSAATLLIFVYAPQTFCRHVRMPRMALLVLCVI
jgi:hypothetical protein